MDELLYLYGRFLHILDEEKTAIPLSFQEDLLKLYSQVLENEKEVIVNNLQTIYNQLQL